MEAPEALVAGITALALALAEGRNSDDLALLAAAFTQLGDTLATMAIQRAKQEELAIKK